MLSSGLRIPLLPLPFLLLLLTAVELSWSFTSEDKKLLVDLHNQYRTKVIPPAADMLKMSWDPELETFAKDYATKCIWEHNADRGQRGENLFAMSGDLDVTAVVENWYSEYQYYNFSTLACEEGQMCGHYTQVVWARSERVGCETVFCNTLENLNDTDMHLVVCNYEPPGNVKGHKPYKEGDPCSMCPEGYSCKDSLCELSTDEKGTTASTEPTGLELTTILSMNPATEEDTTMGSASGTSEPPLVGTESGSESPTDQGPTVGPEPLTSQELQADSLVTTGSMPFPEDLTPIPTTPEMGSKQTTRSDVPLSDSLTTIKITTAEMVQPLTTTVPVHSTQTTQKSPTTSKPPLPPKAPIIPKPPPTTKYPSSFRAPTSLKPPTYPKAPPFIPKKLPISKTPARHRLAAYSKAIKRQNKAVQSSAVKASTMSVCLPCLGCKQISGPEEIKDTLQELTLRYPYAPCFASLPRWKRHTKCSWCGHTWENALRKARPYWLNGL